MQLKKFQKPKQNLDEGYRRRYYEKNFAELRINPIYCKIIDRVSNGIRILYTVNTGIRILPWYTGIPGYFFRYPGIQVGAVYRWLYTAGNLRTN